MLKVGCYLVPQLASLGEDECARASPKDVEARAITACLGERAWVQRGAGGVGSLPFLSEYFDHMLDCRGKKKKKK